MSGTMVVLFPALRHVIPSDYEAWFEQMAAEGWHIDTIKQWDSVFIKFHRGIPKQYRFVYDPQVSPRKDYIPFYEQFGWEHLGCMASAHIWRMEFDGERPQAFSDMPLAGIHFPKLIHCLLRVSKIILLTLYCK